MAPSFEIKAIRSWTRARKDRASGRAPGTTNGSTPGGATELASVLEAYDNRFESAAVAERTDAERHADFEREAERLLGSVIAPALDRIGRQIGEHGHAWTVESRVDILGQPAIACSFRPREARGKGRAPSELSFRFLFPDRLTVSGAAMGGGELAELPPRSHQMAAVDADLVVREVTRFVSVILRKA